MTRTPPSPSSTLLLPPAPVVAEGEPVERLLAAWARWADDETALPDAALDAALVRLLHEIRHSL
ncbi:MAG TPA: hypothetical protein VFD43_12830 [Planctomycetota bacterium]|nr:hypothetical protein [Planctomycetota bacterium]